MDEQDGQITHYATIVTISTNMTRLGFCTDLCDKIGIRHTQGTDGKRYCLPHTRIMLHQPLGDFEGPATDFDIHAKEILQVRRQLDGILARHTAQSLQRIRKDTERDYFMDPRDAVEYGLIDDILQRRDSLPNN
jgi:ATP-dependent Clp endopeptidase proteolytic subunit ClpP